MDEDGAVHLKLDQHTLKPNPAEDLDNESGERLRGKFELDDEEFEDKADDGLRDIWFSAMISPKLVQTSSVQVPESSHIQDLDNGQAPPASNGEESTVIPESAQHTVESHGSAQPQISMEEITTPRRDEITKIIKEAGFHSALDDQLLEPVDNGTEQSTSQNLDVPNDSQGDYPHRFRRRSPRIALPPTEDQPSSETNANTASRVKVDDASWAFDSEVPPTSSPVVHTQESVGYPHISQMEINSSGMAQTANSSTHQDAQNVSPAPVLDSSFPISEYGKSGGDSDYDPDESHDLHDDEEDEAASQLQMGLVEAEGPHTQAQGESYTSPRDVESGQDASSDQRVSFLEDRGYDGHDSSYHDEGSNYDDDDDDDDSDGLPSIRALTSSQRYRRETRQSSAKVSPPQTRKSARTSIKMQHATPLLSQDLPPSSQPSPELSPSQEPPLSQIPPGSQVVDLTQSSDVGYSDSDYYASPGTKPKAEPQLNGIKNSDQRPKMPVAPNVGTRRLLTTKRKRSYI
jgi:hypothetical protein